MGRPFGRPRNSKSWAPWAIAAKRIGVSLEEYARERTAGRLWCWRGRHWRAAERFGIDRARRYGGRNTCCIECQADVDRGRDR